MTRGIYRLYLGEQNIFYVGQSLNIEERVTQHKSLLKCNKHYNWKLQKAFNYTKVFEYTVLEVCDSGNTLYEREAYYMNVYSAISTGYNIAEAGISGSGTNHPSSVYSKEQILDVVSLCLNPLNTFKFISEVTAVSISTVNHIANRDVHHWLEDVMPEECKKLVEIKEARLRNSSLRSKKEYKFTSIISPEGIVYDIVNISAFAREHGLDGNKIGEIMRGTRNMHKNWRGHTNVN